MDNPYLASMGLAQPPKPESATRALDLLKPLTEGGGKFVHIPGVDLDKDDSLLQSFVAAEKFLPSLGLSAVNAPDGGAYVFDPSKIDPKQINLKSSNATVEKTDDEEPETKSAPAPQAAPAPAAPSGDERAVQGQRQVNAGRAKNLEAPSPGQTGGFLGQMMKRAY
jgi:hypothetical protein